VKRKVPESMRAGKRIYAKNKNSIFGSFLNNDYHTASIAKEFIPGSEGGREGAYTINKTNVPLSSSPLVL
jgi:hypothetical protein